MTPADAITEAMRHMDAEVPEDAATVVLGALADQGMVVVYVEDLDVIINRGDRAVGWARYSEACDRLRSALPERTSDA